MYDRMSSFVFPVGLDFKDKIQIFFSCSEIYNKHHTAERWDLKAKFKIPPLRRVMFIMKTTTPNTTDFQWNLA